MGAQSRAAAGKVSSARSRHIHVGPPVCWQIGGLIVSVLRSTPLSYHSRKMHTSGQRSVRQITARSVASAPRLCRKQAGLLALWRTGENIEDFQYPVDLLPFAWFRRPHDRKVTRAASLDGPFRPGVWPVAIARSPWRRCLSCLGWERSVLYKHTQPLGSSVY
jgi:hypothetical protein